MSDYILVDIYGNIPDIGKDTNWNCKMNYHVINMLTQRPLRLRLRV